MSNPPDEVRGTPEFVAFFKGLRRKSYRYKVTKEAIDVLRANMLVGEKVEKRKWPKVYVEKYRIRNLFLMDLGRRYRLTYNILSEGHKRIVCIIEVMNHSTYERRFGYS
jgi:hypothetical protein